MGGVPWIYEAPSRPATQEASSGFKVEADDARAVRFRAKLSVFLKFQSAVNPQFYYAIAITKISAARHCA